MKKLTGIIAILTFLLFAQQAHAQKCGLPVPITSVYYLHTPHAKFGIGLEAGSQSIETPFGIFAGVNFARLTEEYQKSGAGDYDFSSSFYLKGLVRITPRDRGGSLYFVGSPAVSMQTGVDFRTGLRAMFPLGRRMGVGVEPLYSIRQKELSVNFVIAF
jgi:hypothetical protein